VLSLPILVEVVEHIISKPCHKDIELLDFMEDQAPDSTNSALFWEKLFILLMESLS
jgi:hypothetical protein